jgi:FkbM family methyltransferase
VDELWANIAFHADARRRRLKSFGPNAFGVLIDTKHGPMVASPEDNYVAAQLLNVGDYDPQTREYLLRFVNDRSNVLVVGAHIGAHAIPLAQRSRHVVAIEANPDTFRYLEVNAAIARAAGTSLAVLNVAASDRDETIEFLLSRENSGGSKRRPIVNKDCYVYDHPRVVELRAVPLDECLEEVDWDLCLMDIEGSEHFAMRGMIRALRRTKVLAMEFVPDHVRDVAGVSIEAFAELFPEHFNFMWVPERIGPVSRDFIVPKMIELFDRNVSIEAMFFSKEDPVGR